MIRVLSVLPAGSWDAESATGTVRLDYEARHRRRLVLTTDGGEDALLDLPRATLLRDGDGLALEGGGVLRVVALPEALAEIEAHGAAALARIAWHLGNRHLPVQFVEGRIRIRADHVIEEMVVILGGRVTQLEAPFDPESGAYAGGHSYHGLAHEH